MQADISDDPLPLSLGSRGSAVRDLQRRLRQTGLLEQVASDGRFDDATRAAVLAFQERAGLGPSGECDKSTWAALVESGYSLGDRLLYYRLPMLRGDDVGTLQRRLGELGFHSGRVDAIFGPETEAAVKSFQRNTGLVTDGVAGPDVIMQLRRLGPGSAGLTKAALAERIQLLDGPHVLRGSRIAVAESGSLPVLAHNVTRRLDATGALTLAIHHPDGSQCAAEANRFEAICFIGCTTGPTSGGRISFYRTEGYESAGGSHLAAVLQRHLEAGAFPGPITTHGMRIPVLRETRMPALWCELGDPAWIVEHAAAVADMIAAAVSEWIAAPIEDIGDNA